MKSKRYRAYNNYEVRCAYPHTIYLVNGRRHAMATARLLDGFARKAFTSPIHNGKKPKKW